MLSPQGNNSKKIKIKMMHEETKTGAGINSRNVFLSSMISGGLAGTVCDLTFFPLDTLKTRLQSQHGFKKSGGFTKLYHGVLPVLIGSAPAASLFFITYEGIKETIQPRVAPSYHLFIHMGAACIGEMAACLVRVPVEVTKQRKQALLKDSRALKLRTLYRGYGSTVLRDMPFGVIQMPLWEYLKLCWQRQVSRDCTPVEGAICGAASVAFAAVITTPLDVAKTRIMLSDTSAEKDEVKISTMLKEVYRERGVKGLFAGFAPRTIGFTIGGFVFFGIYEKVKALCSTVFPYTSSSVSSSISS